MSFFPNAHSNNCDIVEGGVDLDKQNSLVLNVVLVSDKCKSVGVPSSYLMRALKDGLLKKLCSWVGIADIFKLLLLC